MARKVKTTGGTKKKGKDSFTIRMRTTGPVRMNPNMKTGSILDRAQGIPTNSPSITRV